MRDRLAELRGQDADDVAVEIDNESVASNYSPLTCCCSQPLDDDRPKFMQQFFQDVEDMQNDLTIIIHASQQIGELNQRALMVTSSLEEHAVSNELAEIVENANTAATRAKGRLEYIKKESSEKKNDKSTVLSEVRIRDNMCATLTKKFVECMKSYQKAQQKYKADMKNKVKRQVQIVKPDASEAEIDAVLRSGDVGSVYKAAILQGTNDCIKEVYMNCQDKYRDVLRLEQSVAELHQMFLDLALLVEQQGELLDQIETQVKTAVNYVDQGNELIEKAIVSQKSARNKKCCLLFIGLAILLAMVVAAIILLK